jgi:hypothetical protein
VHFFQRLTICSLLALALSFPVHAACGPGIENCEPSIEDARAKVEQLLRTAYVTPPKIDSLEKLDGRHVETHSRKIYEMRIFAVTTYDGDKLQCRINLCPQLSNYLVEVDQAAKKATIAGWLFFEATDGGWR